MRIDTSFRDTYRKQRRQQHDPIAAQVARVRSTEPTTLGAPPEPYECMVSDPLADYAKAQEAFQDQQVGAGLEILGGNGGIDTAADLANVAAANEYLANRPPADPHPGGVLPGQAPVYPGSLPSGVGATPYDRIRQGPSPVNNPFSTVPGGPGFGPAPGG